MLGRLRRGECSGIRDTLSAYLDKELSLEEQKMIEDHLSICQRCRIELDSMQSMVALLHRVPDIEVPYSFRVIETKPVRRSAAFGVLRAATVVTAMLLVALFAGDFWQLIPGGYEEANVIMMDGAVEEQPFMQRESEAPFIMPQPSGSSDIQARAPVPAPEKDAGVQPGAGVLTGEPGQLEKEDAKTKWPVRQLEMALLGMTIVLVVVTIAIWRRGEKRGRRSDT